MEVTVNFDKFNTNFGEIVKTRRIKNKLTQDDLGKKLGISRVVISDIENGKYNMMHVDFVKLVKFFKINILKI